MPYKIYSRQQIGETIVIHTLTMIVTLTLMMEIEKQ